MAKSDKITTHRDGADLPNLATRRSSGPGGGRSFDPCPSDLHILCDLLDVVAQVKPRLRCVRYLYWQLQQLQTFRVHYVRRMMPVSRSRSEQNVQPQSCPRGCRGTRNIVNRFGSVGKRSPRTRMEINPTSVARPSWAPGPTRRRAPGAERASCDGPH